MQGVANSAPELGLNFAGVEMRRAMAARYVDRKAIANAAKKLHQDNEAWVRQHHSAKRRSIRVVRTHRAIPAR